MPLSLRYLIASTLLLLLLGGGIWYWKGNKVEPRPTSTASPRTEVKPPPRKVETPQPPPVSDPWFLTMSHVGIDFKHHSGASPEKPFPAANGSGIAALDYDLDGLYDLYFVSGTFFPIDQTRKEPINRCYRNLGNWQFQDVTQQTGLGHNGYSAGVTVGDYNSDGFPDVFVACYGADVLFRNMGDGTFQALDSSSGANDSRWATSAAMFDYDANGLLDIYVCNYGKWTLETNQWCGDPTRNVRYYCSPKTIEPEVGALLSNQGDDTFQDNTEAAGLAQRLGRAQGVVAADFNADGAIDLYIGNDLHANSLFINDGNGRFRDETEASGAGYDYLGSMQAGMGVDAADANADGLPELFVTNFESEPNAYYENAGNNLFRDVSQQRGLYTESIPWVGWGTNFADFDLDGWLDLIVTNGHVDDNRQNIPYEEPPLFWQNVQGRFAFMGTRAGDYFAGTYVGRALSVADLDNDGDQDVVVGHQDASPAVLQNTRRSPNHRERQSIRLRLIGTQSNRDAVGSVVTLRNGEYVRVLQVKGGSSYLSAHDLRLLFAVPQANSVSQIEIRWPDGTQTILKDLAVGLEYTVVQPSDVVGEARIFSTGEFP